MRTLKRNGIFGGIRRILPRLKATPSPSSGLRGTHAQHPPTGRKGVEVAINMIVIIVLMLLAAAAIFWLIGWFDPYAVTSVPSQLCRWSCPKLMSVVSSILKVISPASMCNWCG